MLVIKDLHSDISDQFWLFYGYKYYHRKYDNDKKGTIYMLGIGTSAECGEEGLVGRGNSSLGIISTFRPNSMEAPSGKNPRYHTGRVLSFLSK